MKAIELKKVSFSYDGKSKILESVDYEVDYGEVSLLSGHSHLLWYTVWFPRHRPLFPVSLD